MNYPPRIVNTNRFLLKAAVGGGIVLACGAPFATERVWSNLLLGTFYFLTLALGGSVFLAITSVTDAAWHVAFRRVPEALARLIPIAGVALLAVVGLNLSRFAWHPHGHGDPGTFWFKAYWLNSSFLLVRSVIYVAVWSLFASQLVARSRRQDVSGDIRITSGTVRLSALYLALFAISFSLAVVDWIMALDPMWFSTIWGVYQFAGMFQATLAVIVIVCNLLGSPKGPLEGKFTREHLHDLGKLLLGFSCFWMYIWICQYMLIWYSNIPEETSYFIVRTQGSWGPVVAFSLVLNWVVPFFVLLPRAAKRSTSVMTKVAIVVLIGRWIDLYQMIFPSTIGSVPVFGLWELAGVSLLIGVTGVCTLSAFRSARPVPLKDPYLNESLHYHAS